MRHLLQRSVGSYMASNKIKHPLVCQECGREGEFAYEKTSPGSKGPRINYESLTPGFRFKDTGYAPTSTISCSKCNEVVFLYSTSYQLALEEVVRLRSNVKRTRDRPMSRRIDKSWLVFASIDNFERNRCVDLFSRPDGSYGFEEFRRDPEDRGEWTPIKYHSRFCLWVARIRACCSDALCDAADGCSPPKPISANTEAIKIELKRHRQERLCAAKFDTRSVRGREPVAEQLRGYLAIRGSISPCRWGRAVRRERDATPSSCQYSIDCPIACASNIKVRWLAHPG